MRNKTVEVMKAIFIMGVVLLHAIFIHYGENTALSNILRLVCVNGFFALSGYVIYGKVSKAEWVIEKLIRRMPMLIIFTVVFWAFNNYVAGVDGGDVLGISLGNYALYNASTGFILSVLWYIWVINIGYVVLWAFERFKFEKVPYLLQVAVLMCITFIPLDYGGFSLFRWYGLFMIAGYAIGYMVKNQKYIYTNVLLVRYKLSKYLMIIGSSTIGILLLHKPILELHLVNNYWLASLIALVGSFVVYQVFSRVKLTNLLLFGGTDIPIQISRKLEVWYGKAKA